MNQVPLYVPNPPQRTTVMCGEQVPIVHMSYWTGTQMLRFHLTAVYEGTGELAFYVHGAGGKVVQLQGGGRIEETIDMHEPCGFLTVDVQGYVPGTYSGDGYSLVIQDLNITVSELESTDAKAA